MGGHMSTQNWKALAADTLLARALLPSTLQTYPVSRRTSLTKGGKNKPSWSVSIMGSFPPRPHGKSRSRLKLWGLHCLAHWNDLVAMPPGLSHLILSSTKGGCFYFAGNLRVNRWENTTSLQSLIKKKMVLQGLVARSAGKKQKEFYFTFNLINHHKIYKLTVLMEQSDVYIFKLNQKKSFYRHAKSNESYW